LVPTNLLLVLLLAETRVKLVFLFSSVASAMLFLLPLTTLSLTSCKVRAIYLSPQDTQSYDSNCFHTNPISYRNFFEIPLSFPENKSHSADKKNLEKNPTVHTSTYL